MPTPRARPQVHRYLLRQLMCLMHALELPVPAHLTNASKLNQLPALHGIALLSSLVTFNRARVTLNFLHAYLATETCKKRARDEGRPKPVRHTPREFVALLLSRSGLATVTAEQLTAWMPKRNLAGLNGYYLTDEGREALGIDGWRAAAPALARTTLDI